MRSAFVGFLLVFFVAVDATHAGSNHARNKNPYTVLGVSRSASQDDVRRRYRKLCLEYHPDKKRHLPEKEQKEYEKLFKELQTAYSQIGSSEARRNYDLSERSPPRNFSTSATQQQYDEAMRRAFEGAFRSHHPRSTVYGFSMNDLFNNNNRSGSPFGFGTSSPLWNPSLKSVYIQKVSIPLQDLYSGKPDYRFTVRDNLISRVMAAFRGGIGFLVLYQSILYALPLIRFSGKLATIIGLYLFYRSIPSAQGSSNNNNNLGVHNAPSFTATLRPGYKQGTKLMFDEEQTGQAGVQVHFILNEAKHPTYRRVGNNLHVTCAISHEQAAAGCHVEIPSLSDEDFVLRVEVPKGTANGDQIVIPGKGWPNRKQKGSKGDLIVTLAVGGIRWWWWRWRGGKGNQWQL